MEAEKQEQIDTYKIVLIGDASVGKTHLFKRYSKDELPKNPTPTIGVEFGAKTVQLKDGTKVKAQIWDTAGQERYRSILSLHFRRSVGALLVYDITKERTYNSLTKWLEELRSIAEPDIVIMLVGNKLDLVTNPESRKVSIQEAQNFALAHKLIFIETSAVLGTNINLVFETLLQNIQDKKRSNPSGDNITIGGSHKGNPPSNGDCAC